MPFRALWLGDKVLATLVLPMPQTFNHGVRANLAPGRANYALSSVKNPCCDHSMTLKCDTHKCHSNPNTFVHWPGQTLYVCGACADRATRVANHMGFGLMIERRTVEPDPERCPDYPCCDCSECANRAAAALSHAENEEQ